MKSFRSLGSGRRPRIEQLEDRNLLAVSVTGDGSSNLVISNDSDGVPDAILIAFVDDNTVDIDGETYTTTGDITINLGSDDEVLDIFGDTVLALSGNLRITSGGGSDVIALSGINVGGDLTIDNGGSLTTEFESVGLIEVNVGGNLSVQGGDAFDIFSFVTGTVDGQFVLSTGASGDIVEIDNVKIRDNAFASLGAGDDFLVWGTPIDGDIAVDGSLTILTGSGSDQISMFGSGAGALRISDGLNIVLGGGGTDSVDLFWLDVGGTTLIGGGGGPQNVSLFDSNLDTLLVTTGGGSDAVNLTRTDFTTGIISTGGGSDTVTIEDSDFGFLILLGGGGSDTLIVVNVDDPYFALSF